MLGMRKRRLPPYVRRRKRVSGEVYEAAVRVGDGYAYGPVRQTPQEAHADAMKMRRRLDRMPAKIPSVAEAFDGVEAELEGNRTKGYVDWFQSQRRMIFRHLREETPITEVGTDVLRAFIRARQRDTVGGTERAVSPNTILAHRRAFSLVFKHALQQGWIDRNPLEVTKWPREVETKRDWLTKEELRALLARIGEESLEDRDVVLLAAWTGLRRSELARLRVEDVDLDGGRLWIRGKTRSEDYGFPAQLRPALERLVARAEGGLLVPGGPQRITLVFRKWAQRLREPRFHAHALRHSLATALLRDGVPIQVVQRVMRHKRITTTMIYTHIADDQLRAAQDGFDLLGE